MNLTLKTTHLTRYMLAVSLFGMLMVFATPSTAYALTIAEFKDIICEGLQGPGAEENCRKQANDGVAVITRACLDGERNCDGIKSRTVKLSAWEDKSKAEFRQSIDEWREAAIESSSPEGCAGIETSLINCEDTGGNPITGLVLQIVNFLAVGVGIAVVGGIIWGGMMYASSNGDQSRIKQGKTIIVNAIVGLLLFIFMYAFINFLVPGGLFT